MKRKNEILVIDLTLEDEQEAKMISREKTKLKKQYLLENKKTVKILKRHTLRFDSSNTFHTKSMATAIANKYAEELLGKHTRELRTLHEQVDVNHTHIPCGDTHDWDNLPVTWKNHFFASIVPRNIFSHSILEILHDVPDCSEAVARTAYYSIQNGISFEIAHLTAIGRLTPIRTVRINPHHLLTLLDPRNAK